MKTDHSYSIQNFLARAGALCIASLFFVACQEEKAEDPAPAPAKKEEKATEVSKEKPEAAAPVKQEEKVAEASKEKPEASPPAKKEKKMAVAPKKETKKKGEASGKMARAYFASGCFWCVEAVYESVKGVKESISGYSGGHTENPTYESSNTGKTGHAEAVEIIYDPSVVDFATLVDVYFGSQNISQKNGQGPDHGSQYRSILFYRDAEQKKIIKDKIAKLEEELGEGQVAAEVMEFEKFWVGEDYHQDYEKLHPNNYYIRNVSIPRLKKFQAKFPHLLKDDSHGE